MNEMLLVWNFPTEATITPLRTQQRQQVCSAYGSYDDIEHLRYDAERDVYELERSNESLRSELHDAQRRILTNEDEQRRLKKTYEETQTLMMRNTSAKKVASVSTSKRESGTEQPSLFIMAILIVLALLCLGII